MEKEYQAGFSAYDTYLFRQGNHYRLYKKLGGHPAVIDGIRGSCFSVWAPNACQVTVIGDFNAWDTLKNPLNARSDGSGIWEGFVEGALTGMRYKYHIISRYRGYCVDKSDPFAFYSEIPPGTASILESTSFQMAGQPWMAQRREAGALLPPYPSMKCIWAHGGKFPAIRDGLPRTP